MKKKCTQHETKPRGKGEQVGTKDKKNTSGAGACLSVRSHHLRQLPQGYTPVQTMAGVCFDEGCVTTHPRGCVTTHPRS